MNKLLLVNFSFKKSQQTSFTSPLQSKPKNVFESSSFISQQVLIFFSSLFPSLVKQSL